MKKIIKKIFIILLWSYITISKASNFSVSPVILHLNQGESVTSLNVTNESNIDTVIQIQTLKWEQNKGMDIYIPTKDLILTPVIFTLNAKETQIVRLGLRQPINNASEATYRIILSELPINIHKVDSPEAINMVLKINMPLFIEPQNIIEKLGLQAKKNGNNQLLVKLINNGNIHAKVNELAVYDANTLIVSKKLTTRILAGASAEVTLNLKKPLLNNQINIIAKETNAKGKDVEVNEAVKIS